LYARRGLPSAARTGGRALPSTAFV
jgi:hypothetical protein